jgi:hypothetical protein
MITCVYMGGLGNQLFEIFAIIGYALKYNDSFIFPYTSTVGKRITYWDSFLSTLKVFTTYNQKYGITTDQLNSIPPEVNCLQHHYIELHQYPNTKITKLYGYFQSYKYFDNYRDRIFQMIRIETQRTNIRNEYSHYFQYTEPTHIISMHFRFGDYKGLQQYHHLLDSTYYINAMNYLKNACNASNIRVLYLCESEDNIIVNNIINKLKKNHPEIEFVKVDDHIEDWKQMLIMSCCDSNIIANSTYSWWGAYFNMSTENKHICYPNKWFGPMNHNYIMDDMFLPSWKKIEA